MFKKILQAIFNNHNLDSSQTNENNDQTCSESQEKLSLAPSTTQEGYQTAPEEPAVKTTKVKVKITPTLDTFNQATLRLFSGIRIIDDAAQNVIDEGLLLQTLAKGYILAPTIPPTQDLLNLIEKTVIVSAEQANNAFHKSWKVVRDSDEEKLIAQQMAHYLTTYGFEAMDVYDSEQVYIPREKLEIPSLSEDLPLRLIRALSTEIVLNKLTILSNGIALADQTLDDMEVIIRWLKPETDFLERIENRELRTRMYDFYDAPTEPEAYLRYLVYQLTSETLLIKNKYLIEKLSLNHDEVLVPLLEQAPADLASIFYRYKPLFLAMKSEKTKTFFNRLRKQAKHKHKPLPSDYLGSVTAQIKAQTLDIEILKSRLENASIYRKIRLANALSYRLNTTSSIVYRVRNGRGWADDFAWDSPKFQTMTQRALDCVKMAIAEDLRPNVEEKTVYVPKYVGYALPATEKQFTGNFPTGSWVAVPEDLLVGIHWTNIKERRVDLDLSLMDISGNKIGWNTSYRNSDGSVLFSGDMTDAPAPKGASELFYIKSQLATPQALMVNDYNFTQSTPVTCRLLVAKDFPDVFDKDYAVNPNHILMQTEIVMEKKQNMLGLIVNTPAVDGTKNENRIYFANLNIGNSITAAHRSETRHAQAYLLNSATQSLMLREILTLAGASVVKERPQNTEFIDLSPDKVNKSTFISLIAPASC